MKRGFVSFFICYLRFAICDLSYEASCSPTLAVTLTWLPTTPSSTSRPWNMPSPSCSYIPIGRASSRAAPAAPSEYRPVEVAGGQREWEHPTRPRRKPGLFLLPTRPQAQARALPGHPVHRLPPQSEPRARASGPRCAAPSQGPDRKSATGSEVRRAPKTSILFIPPAAGDYQSSPSSRNTLWASACPCRAALRHHCTASAWFCGTPRPA